MSGVVDLFAGSPSIVHFDDGAEYAARELASEAATVAAWLHDQGVRHGDRVALHLPNSPAAVRALLGCASLGAVAVAVNTRYSRDEVDDLIERSGAMLTIRSLDLPMTRSIAAPSGPVGGADDPYVVFTTSGTTSRPKMVLHRQRSIAEHAVDVATAFECTPADVALVAMPLCGTFGLASLTGAVAGGATVHVTDFELERAADIIARRRVTWVNGSDDMFHRLVESGADLRSIRLGGYARFNTSLDGIVERAGAAGATLVGLYGMSEVQALFAVRSSSAPIGERERAGGRLASPRAQYRVVDDELQLRGPSLFAGYLAEGGAEIDAELTARHHVDGWFRTGDAAAADGDRAFEYHTRMGDVLRLGGFLVAPAEIEGVLTELAAVTAAQVVAVERPGGTRPVAFVITADGADADEAAAIAHCRDRLAIYKCPVRVVTIDEFPTTPSANGTKIQKVKLRALADALFDEPRPSPG